MNMYGEQDDAEEVILDFNIDGSTVFSSPQQFGARVAEQETQVLSAARVPDSCG